MGHPPGVLADTFIIANYFIKLQMYLLSTETIFLGGAG